jgi:biopolymer transport protein ExbD
MAKSAVYGTEGGSGDVNFNMTPMIDCTFQLIIFFILASQIASEETAKKVKVTRPHMSQALAASEGGTIPNRLVINVTSADPDSLSSDKLAAARAGTYKIRTRKIDIGDEEALVEEIKNTQEEMKKTGAISDTDEKKKLFIEIRADKRVNWEDVAPVIRAGVHAGVAKMSLTALTAQK